MGEKFKFKAVNKPEEEKKISSKEIRGLLPGEITGKILEISNRVIQESVFKNNTFENDTLFSKEMRVELVKENIGNERVLGESEKMILILSVEGKLHELNDKLKEAIQLKLDQELSRMKNEGKLNNETGFDIYRFEDDISVKPLIKEDRGGVFLSKVLISRGELLQ